MITKENMLNFKNTVIALDDMGDKFKSLFHRWKTS